MNGAVAPSRPGLRRPLCRAAVLGKVVTLSAATLLAAACSDSTTSIVLEVNSALSPGSLDRVTFQLAGPGLGATGRTVIAPLTGAGAKTFPLLLTLVHGGAALGPLDAVVEGSYAGAVLARAPGGGGLFFESGRVVRKSLILDRIGGGGPGADAGGDARGGPDGEVVVDGAVTGDRPPTPATDASTDAGGRESGGSETGGGSDAGSPPDAVSPSDAPRETGIDTSSDTSPPLEAGTDVSGDRTPDATPPSPDAGSGCAPQTCPEGSSCLCAAGCGCALSCERNQDCEATCTGAGTRCMVEASGVSNGRVTCSEGATCVVNGNGNTSNLMVSCLGATCEVSCTGNVSNCTVACPAGSSCLIRCSGASNCAITGCAGGVSTCSGNLYACNRSCP